MAVINSISTWVDLGPGEAEWVVTIPLEQEIDLGAFQVSNWLADDIHNPYAGAYNFRVSVRGSIAGAGGFTGQILMHFLDVEQNIIESSVPVDIPNLGLVDAEIPLESDVAPFYVMLQVINGTGSPNTITVSSVTLDPPPPVKVAHIDIPIVNALRFVITEGPGVNNSLQNFDNRLFRNMRFPGVEPECYNQHVAQDDSRTTQFRSNYASHTAKLMNKADDTEAGIIPVEQVKDFTQQLQTDSVQLADAGANKTQVFFENGLPDWAQIGEDIELNDTGEVVFDGITFEIEDIRPGILDAEGYVVLIINATFPGSNIIAGSADVEYDIEPFDVFEFTLNAGAFANGQYYILLEGSDPDTGDFTAQSEPIEIANSFKDSILFVYKNVDNAFKIFYDTGIEHHVRIEGELKWSQPGGEEVNHVDSENRVIKLRENVTRNPQLFLFNIPPYLAEKLALMCAHDTLVVNGVQYAKMDEKVEVEYFQNDPMCNAKVKLRQVDFIAENTVDAGDVDVPKTVLEINGTLLSLNP